MTDLKPPRFPTMLRKMWSGGEVQAWIDENWNRRAHPAAPADAAPSVAPEPVAWRYVPSEVWCDHILTEDTKTVELARQYGREVEGLYTYSQLLAAIAAAHPPRAPLTEEIESADNLLRHLGLDPERCRTEGGSLNVSRIKTLLADAAPSVAPEPVAWTLQSELDAAQTTCSAHLWFTNPRNSAWTALFTREQIAAHPPRAPLTEEQRRDLVKECGLDWQRGYMPLFEGDPTNRYAVLVEAVEAAHGIGGK